MPCLAVYTKFRTATCKLPYQLLSEDTPLCKINKYMGRWPTSLEGLLFHAGQYAVTCVNKCFAFAQSKQTAVPCPQLILAVNTERLVLRLAD